MQLFKALQSMESCSETFSIIAPHIFTFFAGASCLIPHFAPSALVQPLLKYNDYQVRLFRIVVLAVSCSSSQYIRSSRTTLAASMIVERAALLRHHHARGARAHNLPLRSSRRDTVALCAWLPESTKMASEGPSASPLPSNYRSLTSRSVRPLGSSR